jgi:hypothetical protein
MMQIWRFKNAGRLMGEAKPPAPFLASAGGLKAQGFQAGLDQQIVHSSKRRSGR